MVLTPNIIASKGLLSSLLKGKVGTLVLTKAFVAAGLGDMAPIVAQLISRDGVLDTLLPGVLAQADSYRQNAQDFVRNKFASVVEPPAGAYDPGLAYAGGPQEFAVGDSFLNDAKKLAKESSDSVNKNKPVESSPEVQKDDIIAPEAQPPVGGGLGGGKTTPQDAQEQQDNGVAPDKSQQVGSPDKQPQEDEEQAQEPASKEKPEPKQKASEGQAKGEDAPQIPISVTLDKPEDSRTIKLDDESEGGAGGEQADEVDPTESQPSVLDDKEPSEEPATESPEEGGKEGEEIPKTKTPEDREKKEEDEKEKEDDEDKEESDSDEDDEDEEGTEEEDDGLGFDKPTDFSAPAEDDSSGAEEEQKDDDKKDPGKEAQTAQQLSKDKNLDAKEKRDKKGKESTKGKEKRPDAERHGSSSSVMVVLWMLHDIVAFVNMILMLIPALNILTGWLVTLMFLGPILFMPFVDGDIFWFTVAYIIGKRTPRGPEDEKQNVVDRFTKEKKEQVVDLAEQEGKRLAKEAIKSLGWYALIIPGIIILFPVDLVIYWIIVIRFTAAKRPTAKKSKEVAFSILEQAKIAKK